MKFKNEIGKSLFGIAKKTLAWQSVFFLLLLSNIAFAQPAFDVCKERCTQAMMDCLHPCANLKPKGSSNASLDCIQECRQKHLPCFKVCEEASPEAGDVTP